MRIFSSFLINSGRRPPEAHPIARARDRSSLPVRAPPVRYSRQGRENPEEIALDAVTVDEDESMFEWRVSRSFSESRPCCQYASLLLQDRRAVRQPRAPLGQLPASGVGRPAAAPEHLVSPQGCPALRFASPGRLRAVRAAKRPSELWGGRPSRCKHGKTDPTRGRKEVWGAGRQCPSACAASLAGGGGDLGLLGVAALYRPRHC